ncbi:MAG TPA: amidase, partial [Acidimicrobiales bacterium]|nr:amidase [Acidimicrobiales bacterium]
TRFDAPAGDRLRVAVKDLIDMAGVPTTNGSKVIAALSEENPPAIDAACMAGTRAAEAEGRVAIVGKTNMNELAFGVTGINPWFGTPVNPLDPALAPGGSSSGSAVAVGAAEADVAFGSDTGGSIRIPAACCGVVGLKTTRGRVPLDGVLPLAPSLDTVGPMAATVAGVVKGMRLLEPGFEAGSVDSGLVVGRVRLPAESWIDEAIDEALAGAGMEVVDVELRRWEEANRAALTLLGSEAWKTHAGLWCSHAADLSPEVSARLESSSKISDEDVASARDEEGRWGEDLQAVFGHVNVLALPTLAEAPPSLDQAGRLSGIRYAAPVNLAGVSALAMPVRAAERAMPASLQLVGTADGEELLCAVAAVIEESAGFTL